MKVFALLAEHRSLVLLDHSARAVVRIHDLIADFVQARPPRSVRFHQAAGGLATAGESTSRIAKVAGNSHFLGRRTSQKCLLRATTRRRIGPGEPGRDRLAKGVGFDERHVRPGLRAFRHDHRREPELRALLSTAFGLGRRPQAPREADLAEGRRRRGERHALSRRGDGERDREVGARLVDAHSAGDVHEDVGLAEREPGVARENGHDHRQPLWDRRRCRPGEAWPGRSAPRATGSRAAAAVVPSSAHATAAPHFAVALAEDRRGIGDSLQTGAGHLEHAELVRRAEAILRGAQDAVRVVAVALELEDAIDEVLEDARPGDRPVLGDVADQEERNTGLLADAEQPRRRLAHLRDRSRRRADLRRVERLDRVDHADVRALALERGAHDVEVRLREDLDLLGAAEPRRAKLDLGRRLLAGHEERPPLARDRGERHQQQRRLPDSRAHRRRGRVTPERGRRRARGRARAPRSRFARPRRPPTSARRSSGRGLRGAVRRRALLRESAEASAARAAPEPAAGRVSALGAGEVNGSRFRHRIESRHAVRRRMCRLRAVRAPPQCSGTTSSGSLLAAVPPRRSSKPGQDQRRTEQLERRGPLVHEQRGEADREQRLERQEDRREGRRQPSERDRDQEPAEHLRAERERISQP